MVPGIWEPGIFDSNLKKKKSADWGPAEMACGAAFEKGPPSPDSRLGAFRGQTCLPRVIYK